MTRFADCGRQALTEARLWPAMPEGHDMHRFLTGSIVGVSLVCTLAAPAAAQDESAYTQGNVWYVTGIDVEDGQFESYLNWLDSEWKQFRNIAAKEGVEVGYHVLVNTTARAGEPDLYLVTINKDFLKTAEGLALEKKVNAAMQKNRKQFETESAGRAPMRKVLSTIELQELKLK
jgi:hypothetical protein